tara:strand:+ start:10307 stop:11200 length:894 start_codon:yes stop_codon:yes gene_type:complete
MGSRYLKDNTCIPKKDSILSIIKNGNRKVILIILDGYPVESVYKELTAKKSNLHNYLKENSMIYGSNYSPYDRTAKSLAYLLADTIYEDGSGCTYPYFGNNYYLDFINSGQFFSQSNTICDSRFSSIKELIKIAPYKIASQIPFLSTTHKNIYTIMHDNAIEACSLGNENLVRLIPSWVRGKTSKLESNLMVFHDFYFHQKYNDISLYPKIDHQLTESLVYLAKELKSNQVIDDLIIMSDHGPRTFSNPLKKDLKGVNNKYKGKSKNENGFFISYIPISSVNKLILEPILKHALYDF